MRDIKFSILLFFLFSTFCIYAQEMENMSPAQLKKMGISADKMGDPYQAIDFYSNYLELGKTDPLITFRIAENYRLARNYKKAAEYYESAYKLEPEKYPKALFYQARMEQSMANYEKAQELFSLFSDEYREAEDSYEMRKLAENGMEGCKLAISDSLKKNAIISHLDESINKAHIESSPILYRGKLLYTTLPIDDIEYYSLEDGQIPRRKFYFVEENMYGWKSKALWDEIDFPENANISSGAFSVDGNSFYFSVCNPRSDGKMNCKIWRSRKNGNDWSDPEPLSDNINHDYYTSTQPTLGLDNKGREILYFVSDRSGGKGGLDIWYSRFDKRDNLFDEARNCGSDINSKGDEYSPFVHPLNNSLYFSSDGHPGYGGLDVFKSFGERSKWEKVKNIGSPINSAFDELYFTLGPTGEKGFFASNREGSVPLKNEHCCDDLYSFVYPDFIQIKLKGEIVDKQSSEPLEGTKIQLYAVTEGSRKEILIKEITPGSNHFELPLEAGQEYVLKAKKDGYLLSEIPVLTAGLHSSAEIFTEVKLEEIPFTAMIIENIYYEFDSAELTEDAKNTIDTTIYPIMLNNPEIIAEISSHTDSKGTEGYNRHLSQKRAESVVKYLRQKGISKQRMQAKGYGESKPIAENKHEDGSDNPAGRAKNRRTEFKVVDIIEQ